MGPCLRRDDSGVHGALPHTTAAHFGAPIIGWIADALGPRWALGVGAASGVLAALVAFVYLALRQNADTRAR